MKYIVMERGFEYNDEGYNQTEFGSPAAVYDTLAEANEQCERQEEKRRAELGKDINSYCYDCCYDWEGEKLCQCEHLEFFYVVSVK